MSCFFFICSIPYASVKGIKTSYKRYHIFKYKNEYVLCEPYIVNKDDWLYKIFRKKGEISERDFPYFLLILKEINPQISNIDVIMPGNHILIPLKKVEKEDYDQTTSGTVDLPVIEFSAVSGDADLTPFIQQYKIKKGDTVSALMDKEFLNKDGSISKEGVKAFRLANPNVRNINLIYEGRNIYLPDPSIKSQSWFQPFISKKKKIDEPLTGKEKETLKKITTHELAQLKKYASLIGGTVLNQGKMYFPDDSGRNRIIDLSAMPVIEKEDGTKMLIVSGDNVNRALLDNVKAYWKDLKVQLMTDTIAQLDSEMGRSTQKMPTKSKKRSITHQEFVKNLLFQIEIDSVTETKISVTLNNIKLDARFDRVIREDSTDLLINFGTVYGLALEVLEKRGFKIVSISPETTRREVIKTLFASLGFSIREDPFVFTGESVEQLSGIYSARGKEKLFIPEKPLGENAKAYLKKEEIKILITTVPTMLSTEDEDME